MKIREALTAIQNIKPNQYDDATMLRWLSMLDGRVYGDIVRWHSDASRKAFKAPYNLESDMETELLIPWPHDEIYLRWLCAQIDFNNGDIERYNNSAAIYCTELQAFADSYNREHMPVQENAFKC